MTRIRRGKSGGQTMKTTLQRCLLCSLLALFVAFNLRHAALRRERAAGRPGPGVDNNASAASAASLRGGRRWVGRDALPFNHESAAGAARNLVVVAGHSVTVSGHLEDADRDEEDWYLLDYQRGRGLPAAIAAHIAAGIREADDDPSALLLFSGGQTRALTGPDGEGSSYYRVADAMDLWRGTSVRARAVSEDFATDSFENLLFSICRFHEVTDRYPERITVVSFTFKRRRFETLHAPALRWPSDRFRYVGVDPDPRTTGFDLQQATDGELQNAAKPFETDPYGCHSAVLQEKRRSRNPFRRTPPYELTCPDLRELLRHCGPELISDDKVPW